MLLVPYLLQIGGAGSARHGQQVLALNCCQIQSAVIFDVSWFLQPTFVRGKKKHHQGLFAFCYNHSSSYHFDKVVALLHPLYGSLVVSLFITITFLPQPCSESADSSERQLRADASGPVLMHRVAGDSSSEALIRNPHSSHSFLFVF